MLSLVALSGGADWALGSASSRAAVCATFFSRRPFGVYGRRTEGGVLPTAGVAIDEGQLSYLYYLTNSANKREEYGALFVLPSDWGLKSPRPLRSRNR